MWSSAHQGNTKIRTQEHIRSVNKGDKNNCHQMETIVTTLNGKTLGCWNKIQLARRKIKESISISELQLRPWTTSQSNLDRR